MPRFQTDDDFYDDPAVTRAGTAAVGLYYRCGIYVARHLLDGFVPSEVATQYGTPEWIKRLTDAGLWETVQGGHVMPRYFAHGNPSRAKVEADRAAKADRQNRWLEKQKKLRNSSSGQRRVSRPSSRASSDLTAGGSQDAALPPSLTGRKKRAPLNSAHAAPAATVHRGPWCGTCDQTTRQIGDPPRRCPECHPLASLSRESA